MRKTKFSNKSASKTFALCYQLRNYLIYSKTPEFFLLTLSKYLRKPFYFYDSGLSHFPTSFSSKVSNYSNIVCKDACCKTPTSMKMGRNFSQRLFI